MPLIFFVVPNSFIMNNFLNSFLKTTILDFIPQQTTYNPHEVVR